jgi:beta-galactosidase
MGIYPVCCLLPMVLMNPDEVKKVIRDNHDGKGPFYIAEWYPAWFDWWGTQHHTVPAENYTARLDRVLAAGISINMYMFHGGTTRAFMNGANYNDKDPFEPQISSYDYDAPLDEAGNATPKFMLFRSIIARHLPAGQTLPPVPLAKPSIAIPEIKLNQSVGLLGILPKPVLSKTPLTFEDLNQNYGFVLYRTTVTGGRTAQLKLNELRDYAIVMVNGKRVGVLDRRHKQDSIAISLPAGKVRLDILVENLGRINFGPYLLKNKKGITESVLFDGKEVYNWAMYRLPFSEVSDIPFATKKTGDMPVVKRGTFNLSEVADTYLDMSRWGKGVVWVNGHNLGRYWSIGPQQTLYLPGEWLKKGQNNIVVFELLNSKMSSLSTSKTPVLNKLQ